MSTSHSTPLHSRRDWLLTAVAATGVTASCIKQAATRKAHLAAAEAEEQARIAAEKRRQEEERARRLQQQILEQLGKEARTRLDASLAADHKAVLSARVEFKREVNAFHAQAMGQVDGVAGTLGSFGDVAALIILMAKDKMNGTNELQKHVSSRLHPVTQIMARMESSTRAALAGLQHAIDANSNALSTQMLEIIQRLGAQQAGGLPTLQAQLVPMVSGIQSHQIRLATAVAVAPLEIAGVVALVKLLGKALGGYAERAAGAGAANVVLAAADGPLPIGEALALLLDVGFLLWTAWDIHHLSQELPAQIRKQLVASLDAQRDEALAAFDRQVTDWQTQAKDLRLRALAPVLKPAAS